MDESQQGWPPSACAVSKGRHRLYIERTISLPYTGPPLMERWRPLQGSGGGNAAVSDFLIDHQGLDGNLSGSDGKQQNKKNKP